MPAASSPGRGSIVSLAPAEAGRLDEDDRGDERRAEDERERRERRRGRQDHEPDLRRGVLAHERAAKQPEPAAERDERRLRPEHDAEPDRREPGEHHAGQLDWAGSAPCSGRKAGDVAAVAGHPLDRERDDRRPRWRAAASTTTAACVSKPNSSGSLVVQPRPGLVGELEEAPRRERGDDAEDGREDEQREEPLARHVRDLRCHASARAFAWANSSSVIRPCWRISPRRVSSVTAVSSSSCDPPPRSLSHVDRTLAMNPPGCASGNSAASPCAARRRRTRPSPQG